MGISTANQISDSGERQAGSKSDKKEKQRRGSSCLQVHPRGVQGYVFICETNEDVEQHSEAEGSRVL